MRVDFVITELFVGGAERCLTELAIGMAQQGDQVRVFSFANLPEGEQRLLADRLLSAGIDITTGDADHANQFLRAFRRLQSWFKESPPDICQTFLFHANVLGTLAAKRSGVNTRIGGIRVAESKPIRIHVERFAARQMTSAVCVSSAVQQFAQRQLKIEQSRSIVIPNSVNVSRFVDAVPMSWTDLQWPPDSVVSLFIGRLHPQKGIDLLQRQIDVLAPANSNRRLLLVGDGPLRGDLETWAEKIGADRVRILPWQKDVAPILKASRVLVLPSRYEGMPNVVLEAMASGKPVVCSRVQGSEELLSHDNGKQAFAPGDDNAMKKLVEQFLCDQSLCEEVGLKNRRRAEVDFSVASMVDAYRRHYQSVLNR
ncbi:MAG: glycosyltransferase [Pirellulaceae bacterium]|nr:glycosyltransferase [Pirellulaceae bacterium]